MNAQERKEEFKGIHEEVVKIDGLTTQETVEVSIAILQEAGKDRRTELLGTRFNNNGNDSQSATYKQKNYLKRLGIKYTDTITKAEASELIDKARNSDGYDTEGGY